MVEFAGFDMPVDFGSILDEHRAVRESAGLFDVSHMGQIFVRGAGANETAEALVSCRVDSLQERQVRYGLLCNERGGVVDDVTIYRDATDALLFCVNAANIDKDREWIQAHVQGGARVDDESAETALLALQGPRSAGILASLCDDPGPERLGRFRFGHFRVAGIESRVSRTGYTGADGFEIYLPATRALAAYEALLEKGAGEGLRPTGLGARDTLRLEAAMPLYGHELDDTTSPLEAGLERFVKRDRGGFIGHDAIEARATRGFERQLVGLEITGRGIAREGYPIFAGENPVGVITSGAPSPTLGRPIGLGYVTPDRANPGTDLEIEIRGRRVGARVVETPFVKPAKAEKKTR